ncbi:MAG: CPBP family intramembrane metalloprotease [Planctomycetes bacterium]|nr:CPBP family intramembrane metalloprotease [Planctomycetota bacterium]
MSSSVVEIARKEIVEILRDRRSLYVLLLLPIALYPVIVIGTTFLATIQIRKLNQQTHPVWVEGWDELPDELQRLLSEPLPEEQDDDLKRGRQLQLRLSAPPGPKGQAGEQVVRDGVAYEELSPEDYYGQALANDAVRAVIRGAPSLVHLDPHAVPKVEVLYNGGIDASNLARKRISAALALYSEAVVAKRVDAAGLPDTTLTPFVTEAVDRGREGAMLGRLLGALLVVLALTGAFYPALDLGAGEKERGTLETLLLAPISRGSVALGKFWAVFAISLVVALLNLLSLGVTFAFSAGSVPGMSFSVDVASLAACFFVLVPLVAMFSALSLATSTYAASYKEGQAYLTPLMILGTLPPLAAALPGLQLNLPLSLAPVLGASLLIKGIFAGTAHLIHGVLVFGSNLVYALVAVRWVASLYDREEVLWRPAAAKAPDLLGLRREGPVGGVPSMPQALALAVVVLCLQFFAGAKAQQASLIAGLVFTLVALVAGSSVGYAWWLRCDLRKTFAWRAPPAWAWPAALLLGLGALAINLDLGYVQQGWLPGRTPEEIVALQEVTDELSALPWPALLLLIAALPAVTEELCFRGFLLQGLRGEVSGKLAIVISALVFAAVHLDPSRLFPQFFAGCLAGALVIRTRSLWPAMLLHFVHNGTLLGLESLDPETAKALVAADGLPSWTLRLSGWGCAALGGALCLVCARRPRSAG